MNKIQTFIGAIRDESLGISLADPWRPSDSAITCVVPIIHADAKKEANYLVLAKADLEIKDSGSISGVTVINHSKLPVFIRLGEVLKGATQERAVTFSQIILPKEQKDIEVRCVHRSRPITPGAGLESWGYSPGKDSLFACSNLGGRGMAGVSQSRSWDLDASYYREASCYLGEPQMDRPIPTSLRDVLNWATTQSDDSTSLRDALADTFKDILEQIPLLDNQIGMALIDKNGFHSLDCFNLHAPWKDVKEAVAGKEVLAISQTDDDGVFIYRPEKAKEAIKSTLSKGFSETEIYDNGPTKTIGLDFSQFIGEAVILNDEVIHLLLARKG